MTEQINVDLDGVHSLAAGALSANGASAEHARAIADIVTAAERDGSTSHGLFRIPFYVRGLTEGGVKGDAIPELSEMRPAALKVDADGGYAPLALELGVAALGASARREGIAALGVTNTYHIAALWPEVERLAHGGLVSFAVTQYMAFVAPAGGTRPVMGTNPMAFGWPRPGEHPLVFDQASSMAARGELLLHQRDGKSLPPGWAIDSDGNPTTDPAKGLAGAQLAFGGHKGASIAMMIELLAGPLLGSYLSLEATEAQPREDLPPLGGELIIAIDPSVWAGDAEHVAAHGERLFETVLSEKDARLPSQRRYAAREKAQEHGVTIPRSLLETVSALHGKTP